MNIKTASRKGIGFGITSGIITTLGLAIGLRSGSASKIIIITGILIIAITDALSDAFGMHLSEEYSNKTSTKEIWRSSIATFLTKFLTALSFVVPFLLTSINFAAFICVIWGILLLCLFSYYIAKRNKAKPLKVIFEHVGIAIVVIIISHFIGNYLGRIK